MDIQQLCVRYPTIGKIVALGNEEREYNPKIARLCDFLCELSADLVDILPEPPPIPAPVAVAQGLASGDVQRVLDVVQQQSEVIAKLQAQLEAQSKPAEVSNGIQQQSSETPQIN